MATDSPLIAYDNQLDAYAFQKGTDSASSPLSDAWTWDNQRVAIPKTDGSGQIVVDFGTSKACDTVILGASRHIPGGYRFEGGTLKIEAKTAVGTFTTVHNAAITAPANHAFVEKLTAHTPILPGSAWNDEAVTVATGRNVRHVNNLFIATGLADCYVSSDGGDNWTATTVAAGVQFYDVAFGANLYVVVGAGGAVYTSPDESTWTVRTYPHSGDVHAVTWDGSQFISVGAAGETATSADGITWTARTQAVTTALYDVKASGGLIVAVGASGEVCTSSDGITWTKGTTPTTNTLYAVAFIVDRWVAVGAGGYIMSSFDGSAWEQLTSPTTDDLHCIATDGATHRASGANGTTIISTDQETWAADTAISSTLTYGMATNNVMWIACKDATIFSNFYAYQYRMTISGLTASSDIIVPEIFLGPRMDMPFIDLPYDPYNEVSKASTFEAENGRINEQLRYRRVELRPKWSHLIQSEYTAVDTFREAHLEKRIPFWFAWQPDTSKEECYMMRHRAKSARLPFITQIHRSFGLDLVEAI
jgi:hypothetical protein